MKFEIIIPTYKRYDVLVRMAGSLKETLMLKNSDRIKDIKCFIYFSQDDEETYLKIKANDPFCYIQHELVIMKESASLIGKMNRYFADHVDCDAVLVLTDDVTFAGSYIMDAILYYELNCSDTQSVLVLKSKNVYSETRVDFNNYSYVILGKHFIARFPDKKVYCPFYTSHGMDCELRDFAQKINKLILFPGKNGLIIHDRGTHHNNSGVRGDEFKSSLKTSSSIYQKRRKRGLIWGINYESLY